MTSDKQTIKLMLAAMLCAAAVVAVGKPLSASYIVTELRCGGQVEPLGIDEQKLQLSWRIEGNARGLRQSAYRVLAASSPERLAEGKADLWDSGKVDSDQSQWVKYAGIAPVSAQRVFWTVQVWSAKGDCATAKPSWFEAGLLNRSDKVAKWIKADPEIVESPAVGEWCDYLMLTKRNRPDWDAFLRERIQKMVRSNVVLLKSFDLEKIPSAVRLYAASRGFYTVYLNGQRVGDAEYESTFGLQPTPPLYLVDTPPLYRAYDVTPFLKKGRNELRVLLSRGRTGVAKHADGYFSIEAKPQLWLQLDSTADGLRRTLAATDTSWKQASGALIKDSFLLGEICDGRIDSLRRDLTDNAAEWKPVKEFEGFPNGQVGKQSDVRWNFIPPERVISRITPVEVFSPAEGVWVYDLGQFISGTVEWIEPKGSKAGEPIVFRLAEKLKRDGLNSPLDDRYYPPGTWVTDPERMISQGDRYGETGSMLVKEFDRTHEALPRVKGKPTTCVPTDLYLGSGKPAAVWRGTARIHNFRYVEVIGPKTPPPLDALHGLFIHSDVERIGGFRSSNPALNEFDERCIRVQMINIHGFIADGSVEKSPWNASADFAARGSGFYTHDISGLLRKMSSDNTVATLVTGKPGQYTTEVDGAFMPPKKPHWSQTSPLWECAMVDLPWYQHLYCGDLRSARASYEAMMAWLRFYFPDNIKSPIYNEFYPDWLSRSHDNGRETQRREPGGRQQTVMQTAMFYQIAGRARFFAAQFGHPDDAAWLERLQETERSEIMDKYWSTEKQTFGDDPKNRFGTDCEDGAVGATLLASPEIRNALADGIARQLRERDYAPINGVCTFAAMLDLMANSDHADAIYRMFNREGYPGIKNMAACYSEGVIESFYAKHPWDACCFAHNDFTQMSRWFYYGLGGLRPDEKLPGFKHFDLVPQVPSELESASIWHESPYGEIVSDWKQENGRLVWNITVPPNSTCTARIPAFSAKSVTENGKPLEKSEGVKFTKTENGRVVCELQSGTYQFDRVISVIKQGEK